MEDLMNQALHHQMNWIAVLVTGAIGFAIGGLWYSKLLFAGAWMKEVGITEADAKKVSVPMLMGSAFALTLLIAYCIARLGLRWSGWEGGLKVGLLVGTAVAASTGINCLFEMRSLRLALINGGHELATCAVMGAVLGAWR